MGELSFGTRIFFGPEALDALGSLAGKRVLVVADRFLAGTDLFKQVTDRLAGSRVEVFDAVAGEPTLGLVAQGVAALEGCNAQAVVAFGGGSAMDCAKALGYCAGRRRELWCIPTTAGTGSEVTAFSVLTDADKGVKYPVVDPSLVPDVALLDGRFLAGVPRAVTADTGLDVLTHAAEAYVSVRANTFTDALAEKAFALAYDRLPGAWAGEGDAREDMLLASTLAGMAFNAAGLGLCHGMAHGVGARLHAPHGRINGLLLPWVIEANSAVPAAARKYARLARLCGLSPTPRALSGALRRLGQRLGLPERLAGELDRRGAAEDALADPCTADDPRSFTVREVEELLGRLVG